MSEIKEFFLDILHTTGMALSSGRHMPSVAMLDRESYHRICAAYEKNRIRRMIRDLERQKLLTVQNKGKQIELNLTEKGKMIALKAEILNSDKKLPDGVVCLVTFDIPENVKKSRQILRLFLKKAGFKQVHLSVWQTSKDLGKPLQQLIDDLGINKWVRVYTATDESV
jgi:DNA-binding transcriptional regulator PaaX